MVFNLKVFTCNLNLKWANDLKKYLNELDEKKVDFELYEKQPCKCNLCLTQRKRSARMQAKVSEIIFEIAKK
jgi:hypothetical protein